MDTVYGDSHRLFLQSMSNWGALSIERARNILSIIVKNDVTSKEELKKIIEEINSKILIFEQEIVFVQHDLENTEYVVFTNTSTSDINKFQNDYTEIERNYFSLILKEIIVARNKCVDPRVVLNLTYQLKSKTFTMTQAEKLIETWIELGYFLKRDNLIYYGPKILGEFSTYLKSNYADYTTDCPLCNKLTFWGVSCDNCEVLIHKFCMKKFVRGSLRCPSCSTTWNQRLD